MGTRRLDRLPALVLADGLRIAIADGLRARALGLAGLRTPPPRTALLIPGCRSVHTFGMRFALDLIWLDEDGAIVGYKPGRFIVRNSWGTGWGDKGYAYPSLAYAQEAFTEAYGVNV